MALTKSKNSGNNDKDKIPVASEEQLLDELRAFKTALSVTQTEHTWEAIDRAVKRFTAVTRGGGCRYEDVYVAGLKDRELAKAIVGALTTERTQLSASALLLISATTRLGHAFLPLVQLYLPAVLRLLSRTNKLYVSRSTACLLAIIRNTRLGSIIPHLREGMDEKAPSHRKGCMLGLLCALGGDEPQYSGVLVDRDVLQRKYLDTIEKTIKIGATDRDIEVRKLAKQAWEIYRNEWSERVEQFAAPLTPIIRKYLDLQATVAPSQPNFGKPGLKPLSRSINGQAPPSPKKVSRPPSPVKAQHPAVRPVKSFAALKTSQPSTSSSLARSTGPVDNLGVSGPSRPGAWPTQRSVSASHVFPSRSTTSRDLLGDILSRSTDTRPAIEKAHSDSSLDLPPTTQDHFRPISVPVMPAPSLSTSAFSVTIEGEAASRAAPVRLPIQPRRGPGHHRPAGAAAPVGKAKRAFLPSSSTSSVRLEAVEEGVPAKRPASAMSQHSGLSEVSAATTPAETASEELTVPSPDTVPSVTQHVGFNILSASAPPSTSMTSSTSSVLPATPATSTTPTSLDLQELLLSSRKTTSSARVPFRPARPALPAQSEATPSTAQPTRRFVSASVAALPPPAKKPAPTSPPKKASTSSLRDHLAQARSTAPPSKTIAKTPTAPPAKRQALASSHGPSSRPAMREGPSKSTTSAAVAPNARSSIFSRLTAPTASSSARAKPTSATQAVRRAASKEEFKKPSPRTTSDKAPSLKSSTSKKPSVEVVAEELLLDKAVPQATDHTKVLAEAARLPLPPSPMHIQTVSIESLLDAEEDPAFEVPRQPEVPKGEEANIEVLAPTSIPSPSVQEPSVDPTAEPTVPSVPDVQEPVLDDIEGEAGNDTVVVRDAIANAGEEPPAVQDSVASLDPVQKVLPDSLTTTSEPNSSNGEIAAASTGLLLEIDQSTAFAFPSSHDEALVLEAQPDSDRAWWDETLQDQGFASPLVPSRSQELAGVAQPAPQGDAFSAFRSTSADDDEEEDDVALLITRELSDDSLNELQSRFMETSRLGLNFEEDDEVDHTPTKLKASVLDGLENEILTMSLKAPRTVQRLAVHKADSPDGKTPTVARTRLVLGEARVNIM